MKLINLEQGSPEWLEFRKNHIGASEAPIILLESHYKKSPLMLWKEKMGLTEPQRANPAMLRGQELEEPARQLFIQQTGIEVMPAVATHDKYEFMHASYDGLSPNRKVAIEIKCHSRELHELALQDQWPKHYSGQFQHQYFVGDGEIEELFYVSYHPDHEQPIKILPIKKDEGYINRMLRAEIKFWDCLVNLIPPDACDLDYSRRCDDEWCITATNVMRYAEQKRHYEALYEQEKAKLVDLSGGTNTIGGGVRLTKSVRKGRVKYDSIPNLIGVNLDEYRTKPTESYYLSAVKDDSFPNGPL